ncbi:DUF503 domain-containing protein [Fundicoccus culcitae]|uniref:DUF503 domain-containing protein n=1 Tax=Fundicoccus culcitae TaxID=2969821 RepID=A0ABY5P6Z7_9LACT|nr:DUF503 domain-containing protein [Fundicoccus culcitae]UUX34509.1 DUF503 domain-containing protein [Fundicoccus culcitae]
MAVVISEVQYYIQDSFTLKDKRQTVKSIIDRMQNKYHIAIAEVEDLDIQNKVTFEMASISNNRKLARSILDKVHREIETNYPVDVIRIQWDEI